MPPKKKPTKAKSNVHPNSLANLSDKYRFGKRPENINRKGRGNKTVKTWLKDLGAQDTYTIPKKLIVSNENGKVIIKTDSAGFKAAMGLLELMSDNNPMVRLAAIKTLIDMEAISKDVKLLQVASEAISTYLLEIVEGLAQYPDKQTVSITDSEGIIEMHTLTPAEYVVLFNKLKPLKLT